MLQVKAASIQKKVSETFDDLYRIVYDALEDNELSEETIRQCENEIYEIIKDKDITFLQLVIVEAMEDYLHNDSVYTTARRLEVEENYVNPEDLFLTLTLYVNARIVYLQNKELQSDYNYRYSFNELSAKLSELIYEFEEFQSKFDEQTQYDEDCKHMFPIFKNMSDDEINQLQIYIGALLDQIQDPNVNVFGLGEKIYSEINGNLLLNIHQIQGLLNDYKCYGKEDGTQRTHKSIFEDLFTNSDEI